MSVVGFMALGSMAPPVDKKPKDVLAPLVDVQELVPGPVTFSVSSQGTVAPVTATTLSAEVAGTVVRMSDRFIAGGSFEAGDELMRIDPTNYEVAVARAEATLSQRQVEYDGARRLNEQGYRAEAELLSAKAALESARADVVRAKRDLERTRVRVPYDGLVQGRESELGNYVAPGSVLGTVFATDRVEVRLPLPDTELAFADLPAAGVDAGENGPRVVLSGQYRGVPTTWEGRIVRTEGVVDQRTRMVFAVAQIEDPYLREDSDDANRTPLPTGTFVTAAIDGVVVDDLVKIPRTLIRGNNQVIFVDDEDQLRLRDLEFVRTDARFAYVLADQLEERRIVTTILEAPLNGMLVRIDEAPPIAGNPDEGDNGGAIAASAGE